MVVWLLDAVRRWWILLFIPSTPIYRRPCGWISAYCRMMISTAAASRQSLGGVECTYQFTPTRAHTTVPCNVHVDLCLNRDIPAWIWQKSWHLPNADTFECGMFGSDTLHPGSLLSNTADRALCDRFNSCRCFSFPPQSYYSLCLSWTFYLLFAISSFYMHRWSDWHYY